jgi:hypothetical protein
MTDIKELNASAPVIRVSPMGVVLRHLAGGAGKTCDEPVEVTLRMRDFGMVTMTDPGTGREQQGAADSLVVFSASQFREILDDRSPADVWQFSLTPAHNGPQSMIYISGGDILSVRVARRVL